MVKQGGLIVVPRLNKKFVKSKALLKRQDLFDKVYMKIAKQIAKLSRAKRKQVGAILVKDHNILSFGYNGTPSKMDNKCEDFDTGETKPEVLHAETNALMKVARTTQTTQGATLYITFSPCYECSKLLIQGGIKQVVYLDEHSCTKGLDLLKSIGIKVRRYKK